MPDASPTTLVILQSGALLGFAVWLLLESLRHQDRALRWMASGGAVAAAGALAPHLGPVPLWGGRLLLASGFVSLLRAFTVAYPGRLPRRLYLGLALVLFTGPAVDALGGLGSLWGRLMQGGALLAAGAIAVWVLLVFLRLREEGECECSWILPAIWLGFVLLLAQAVAEAFLGPLPGISLAALFLLLLALAGSAMKDSSRHLHIQAEHLELEIEAWRALLKGPTWRTGEPSDAMAAQFGSRWGAHRGDTLLGQDGHPFRLHRVELSDGAEVGWAEPLLTEDVADQQPFLKGWSIGLGMEEGPRAADVRSWLEDWGAVVTPVGTVPPREAPYPNLLLWAREPGILAVWRELDLSRRRCRWVQVGGTDLEGPHAQLPQSFTEQELKESLRSLVWPSGRPGAGRA